jgi:hypothetical protein
MSNNEDDEVFKAYILNLLKSIKSKMKTSTIVVGKSNNDVCYSVFSVRSEAAESDSGFMYIGGYKFIFKWLRYPNG